MQPLDQITTPEQLLQLLQQKNAVPNFEPANLKYAIYVRKSTEEDTKQVRSIEDQLAECRLLAQRSNIVVLEENIIRESGSARASGIRPQFRKMLDRIIAGELNGIIAWHPDRLTRNMLEAGEIIDLLDNEIIKDLKFVSHPFSNDAAGKMLLGILFVMAKQYSEKLSVDITRGNDRSTMEGRMVGISKHGYMKDANGRLRPDGDNFAILYEAFRRKLNGDTLEKVAKYVREAGYFRRGKDNREVRVNIHPSTMGKIFSDPVYTGILKYGQQYVNLMELFDFVPMLTVEEYIKLNKFRSYDQAFKVRKTKRSDSLKKADLLSGRVLCSACGEVTQAGISASRTKKKYYYFRCETEGCERENKGTRAKVIVEFVKEFLAQKPFTSKKAYSSYKQEIVRIQHQAMAELNGQINASKRHTGLLNDDIASIKSNLSKETDEEVKRVQKDELKLLDEKLLAAKTLLEELLSKKAKVSKAPITFEEFTAIMEALPDKIDKVQSTTELNAIISKIFLNLTVDTKNVVAYTLNKPFDGLISKDFSKGGDGGNCTRVQRREYERFYTT